MTNLLIAIITGLLGYFFRTLRDSIKDLQKRLPKEEPDLGATPASYGQTRGYTSKDKDVGLVETKTPELLEWEAEEKLRQEQFK